MIKRHFSWCVPLEILHFSSKKQKQNHSLIKWQVNPCGSFYFDEALDSVNNTLKNVNEVLYSSQTSHLNNSLFEQIIEQEHDLFKNMTQADDMIPKQISSIQVERSRPVNDKNKRNSSACPTTNNDLLAYLKRLDQKMVGLDNKLRKLDTIQKEVSNLYEEMKKLCAR